MSQGYQGSDCFLFDIEPNFDALPNNVSHRKPSYDDLLCGLLGNTATDVFDAPIIESIRPKGKKLASQSSTEKKEKKRRQGGKTLGEGQQRGHWKMEENKRYHWFLELHASHFLQKHLRRMDKIFKTMQRFVGTRQAEQCRSHHQKMEKKHGNFICILKELRRLLYGTGDADCIISDMKFNGIQCNEELLSWGYLENIGAVREEREMRDSSEKETVYEVSPKDSFMDPIAELNYQYEPDLELLVL